ncbi:MAG: TonB-dependent receptor [Verrucomicrobiota bacterium]
MKTTTRALTATTAFLLLPFSFATAAEPLDPVLIVGELDTYVITPSRVEETWFETPFVVESLPENVLIERAVRSVPEALEQTPGVIVQKTAHGQGSPFIRGFTAYHNLFLIDGIRLNNAAFRSGPNQYWNTVDAYGLRGIELVKSQGSVLYGSDAVGGTLQAFTHRPYYAEEGFHSGGRSYSRYATAENSFIQRGEYSMSEAGKWGLIIGGTFKDFGDIEAAGLGTLPFTGYDEWDIDAKLEYWLNEDTRLTFFHQQVHVNDAWRVHKTRFAVPFAGSSIGSENRRILDQNRMLSYIQLDSSAATPWFDHMTLSVSHQQHDEQRLRERSDGRVDIQGFTLDSYGAWGQFDKALSWTDLTYGFSYYQDSADSFRNDFNADGSFRGSRIQGPIGDDATYHLASAFFNTSTELNDRLTADIGGRYTYASADIDRVQDPQIGNQISIDDSWNNFVASGRASYRLDDADTLRLFGGVSQAFRAPGFSDLSRLDTNRSNEIETPTPNLDPEEFLTYEIGIKKQTDKMSLGLSWFYTNVNDLILRTPTGRVIEGLNEVTKSNVGDGHVQGVELNGSFALNSNLTLFGGFAYQDSQVSTFPTSEPVLRDEVLSRIMPTNGHAGLRWDVNDKLWIEGLVTAVGPGDRLSTRDRRDTQRIPPGGTPSYWLGTLRSGYQVKDGFLVTAAVENIWDEEYRAHGSGQNEPGVNFVFGAEIRF